MTESVEPCVLCVLSDAQRSAYSAEFDSLSEAGINLLYQDSPDDGLSQVGRLKPRLVIVGMNVDMMEGLEFVALLMKRYPDFDREIIVLPDKGDPFPPVAQRRDASTGRSITEHIDIDAVRGRIRAAVQDAPAASTSSGADDVYAEAAAEFDATPSLTATGNKLVVDINAEVADVPIAIPAQPQPEVEVEVEVEAAPEVEPLDPELIVQPPETAEPAPMAAQPAESRPPRMKWALIIAAVVLASAGAAVIMSGGSESTGDTTSTPDAPTSVVPKGESTPVTPKQRAEAPAPKSEIAQEQPTPPKAPSAPAMDLSDPVTVPVSFARRQVEPGEITDQAALDTLLASLNDALRDNPAARIEVGGHTSQEGSPESNKTLGRRRARAAGKWLAERGLPKDRIVLENYASSKPVATNDTDEGRQENRRVTVRLLP